MEALRLCLHHHFSKFNKQYFIQPAMGPEFGCAYIDLALYGYDEKFVKYGGKNLDFYGRYRDDIIILWHGTIEEFDENVLSPINKIDQNMQFTLEQYGKKVHYLCDEIEIFEYDNPDDDDDLIVNLWAKKTNKFGYLTGDSQP